MKALEDDSDFRLKTLKENDMDNKDIEEIKTRLKVMKHHVRKILQCFGSGSAWIVLILVCWIRIQDGKNYQQNRKK
jgi:hypothetical protein